MLLRNIQIMGIFKTLKKLAYFLEYSERTNPNFWFFTGLFAIILNFSPLNPGYSIQSPTTKPCIEKTVAGQTALRICGGDGFGTGGFPSYGHGSHQGAADRGADRGENLDPKPRLPAGTGASGNSGSSSSSLSANKVPDPSEWDLDPKSWVDDAGDSCQDFEESESSDKLPVPVNFEYVKDSNGNPTLLVPNIDSTRTDKGRSLNRVEYDQTASHLQHAPEMGIQLPKNFNLETYKSMAKPEKIKYAKKNVPRETIISFQNACAMAISPKDGIKTLPVRGFAGIRKENVGMVIQNIPNSDNRYLSIIRDDGTHISSYPVSPEKLLKIVQDGFWVWKDRNFN